MCGHCSIREIGVPPEATGQIHEDRLQQLIREARISDTHQIARYTVPRRRGILVASVIDLETRLTDAALDMTDKLIGSLFARPKSSRTAVCRWDEKRRPLDAPVP
jgi:hypothetical protein